LRYFFSFSFLLLIFLLMLLSTFPFSLPALSYHFFF
jgi:hypothetical protein